MPKQSEEKVHRAIADYCGAVLPTSVFWTTVGHGGGGRLRGAILNGLGLKAGVPDMAFVYRSRAYFIEIKAEGGKLSPAQRDCHEDLFEAGACVATADRLTMYVRLSQRGRSQRAMLTHKRRRTQHDVR